MQQQLLAVPNICAKACNPVAFFFGDKTINPGKFCLFSQLHAAAMYVLLFRDSVFSSTIHSARPIEGVHESCFCFTVVQSNGCAKGLKK